MILLSNLIKSTFYIPQEEIKTLEANKLKKNYLKPSFDSHEEDTVHEPIHTKDHEEAQLMKEQILRDAELAADQILEQGKAEAEQIKNLALQEIEGWWEERRQQDDNTMELARHSGYQTGYDEGTTAAELQVNERYMGMMIEAQAVLEQSYELHRKTILEAELFLLEMSCAIAEKIISKKLDQSNEWITDMVKQSLQRSTEKGTIAICVAPAQFTYIQSVREELSYSIDPQAELHIYPDASVKDHGCVIKTSFGSIDARVDTQLKEIKRALMDIAKRGVDTVDP
jgi:flagellar assembly protein FliH